MSTFLNAARLLPGTQRLIQGAFLVLILVASVSGSRKK
jgi:ribose transport system permease protein